MGQTEPVTKDYAKHKVMFYRVFERFFGAKGRKLDENILNGYWRALGNYQIDLLSKALDAIAIRDNSFMPDAGNIIEEMRNIRRSETTSIIPTYCHVCHTTGIVLVTKMHDGKPYETAYRCDCSNGQRVDNKIKSVTTVGAIHSEPDFVAEKKLPIASLADLAALPKDHVWEDGVEVSKICAECTRPYSVRHERRVTAGELQETHITKRTRPHVCELCFIEEGRRRGAWL